MSRIGETIKNKKIKMEETIQEEKVELPAEDNATEVPAEPVE